MRYAGFSGSFRYVRTCNPKKNGKKKLKNFVGGGDIYYICGSKLNFSIFGVSK